jgi:hypothetical protein
MKLGSSPLDDRIQSAAAAGSALPSRGGRPHSLTSHRQLTGPSRPASDTLALERSPPNGRSCSCSAHPSSARCPSNQPSGAVDGHGLRSRGQRRGGRAGRGSASVSYGSGCVARATPSRAFTTVGGWSRGGMASLVSISRAWLRGLAGAPGHRKKPATTRSQSGWQPAAPRRSGNFSSNSGTPPAALSV